MKKLKFSIVTLSLLATMSANALDLSTVTNAVDTFNSKKEQFSSLDLSSLGLDGFDYDDVTNLSVSAFGGFLSAECAIPTIPSISEAFCATLLSGKATNLDYSLNLGLCEVGAGGGAGGDTIEETQNKYRNMAIEMCNKGAKSVNYISQSANKYVAELGGKVVSATAPITTVKMESKYAQKRDISLNDVKLPNGKKKSDYVKPDGTLGFDKMYDNSNDIPKALRTAYFGDNYALYNIYEKFAENATPDSSGKVNFKDMIPDVPETFLDYIQETQVMAKEAFAEIPTIYEIEKKLNNEFSDLTKDNPVSLNGSSTNMKAQLLSNKKALLQEFMDINVSASEYDDSDVKVLAKTLNAIEKKENIAFSESEDTYKYENGYIINPSLLKANALSSNNKIIYADKVRRQQRAEINRMADFMRKRKNNQEMVKLLAEKVFIANFDFNSQIAEKEIDEILSQAQTN
ncbi:hypothetical protein [Poseidonibacter ostreae]|uniref:Conjugal transfer protein TraG n=1 Tax=Poseidonibacter ostreae TaxID=2654171 RepID=A0A6L4WWL6_9BACT|nr:hypothetical protein [Poseidonibacter ostreae]KAB7891281.1 hypothetical protein GBG19_00160 [Poseidonibacter ostreae]